MTPQTTKNAEMRPILMHIAVFAVVLTGGALLVGGAPVAHGAAAGGAVAVANWLALRWVALRILNGTVQQRAAVVVLMSAKLGVLGVVSWVLLVQWGLHPVGYLVGLTALVFGALTGAPATHRQLAGEEGEHAAR
jgi:hypothetical protein